MGNMISPSVYTSNTTLHTWLNTTGLFRCSATRHSTCNVLDDPHIIISCFNGFSLTIKQLVNCHTKYVIYIITCTACDIQYIGRTTRCLSDRITDHLSDIKTTKNTNIEKHFNLYHQRNTPQITERSNCPIRCGDRFSHLCKREGYWIFRMDTRIPKSLNYEWNITDYYE